MDRRARFRPGGDSGRHGGADLLGYYERYAPLLEEPWDRVRAALARPLPTAIWANTLRTDGAALWHRLRAELGVAPEPIGWHPGAFRWPEGATSPGLTTAYAAGLFTVQEEAALLPVHLLAPRPGERILDLCAAPGNKTVQAAVRLRDTGCVVANDNKWARLAPLRRVLERLGLTQVTALVGNAAAFPRSAGPFDATIADVPCSCDGTVRKHPRVVRQQDPARRERIAGVQAAILRRALAVTRPGGRVVYATCTFAPEENEAVVDAVLRDPPCEVTVRPVAVPGLRLAPGVTQWQGRAFLPEVARSVRLWPHHNDTGGFFVALLDRGRDRRPLVSVPGDPPPRGTSPDAGSPPARGTRAATDGAPEAPRRRVSRRRWAARPLPAQERRERLARLCERFGWPLRMFADFELVQSNKTHLALLPRQPEPPGLPDAVFRGILLLHVNMADPKPTTAAAMRFGPAARRNHVALSAAQARAFLARETVRPTPGQLRRCTRPGWVLVRQGAVYLGVARWVRDEDGDRLESHYPKAWAVPPEPRAV